MGLGRTSDLVKAVLNSNNLLTPLQNGCNDESASAATACLLDWRSLSGNVY